LQVRLKCAEGSWNAHALEDERKVRHQVGGRRRGPICLQGVELRLEGGDFLGGLLDPLVQLRALRVDGGEFPLELGVVLGPIVECGNALRQPGLRRAERIQLGSDLCDLRVGV